MWSRTYFPKPSDRIGSIAVQARHPDMRNLIEDPHVSAAANSGKQDDFKGERLKHVDEQMFMRQTYLSLRKPATKSIENFSKATSILSSPYQGIVLLPMRRRGEITHPAVWDT